MECLLLILVRVIITRKEKNGIAQTGDSIPHSLLNVIPQRCSDDDSAFVKIVYLLFVGKEFLRCLTGKGFEFLYEMCLIVEACFVTQLGKGQFLVVLMNSILHSND